MTEAISNAPPLTWPLPPWQARLREELWGRSSDGWSGDADAIDPDAAFEVVVAEVLRYRQALERAEEAMTCTVVEGASCYCPNCGRGKENAREAVRQALREGI